MALGVKVDEWSASSGQERENCKTIPVESFNQECRLCLTTESSKLYPINGTVNNVAVIEMIETCLQTKISDLVAVSRICEACLVKVELLFTLYEEFKENESQHLWRGNDRDKLQTTAANVESLKGVVHNPSSAATKDIWSILGVVMKKYECDFCGINFPSKSKFIIHLKQHTGERPFPCDLCEKRFNTNALVKMHRISHTGEKAFACDLCEKRFITNQKLKTHRRTHTGEKPFACDLCDKRFNTNIQVKTHRIAHIGEKPFACDMCEKRFTNHQHVKAHRRTHTGEKPYACDFCEKRFNTKSQLREHHKTHTGERPFGCALCGKRFSSKTLMRRHKRCNAVKETRVTMSP